MKKITALFFTLAIMLFFTGNTVAQEKAKTEITTVKQKGETVHFTLTSSKPFIFGNNRYVLYIGEKEFFRLEQSKKNGKGYMTFYIPIQDFNNLREGDGIYLSYGTVDTGDENLEEVAKGCRCWSLGKFSKSLLK